MDIEKLIKETFTAHEHVAPDEDAVLAAARRRVDRRRTMLSRPLAVAAGVAVLTLAAAAVVVLNRPSTQGAPADELQVADSATKAPPEIPALTMPYSLGWLPEGEIEYRVHRINTGAAADAPETPLYGGEYMFTVTTGDQVLNVDVQQFKMTPVAGAAFKSGPGNDVTIGGQPGVETANPEAAGGYELYVAHPDGGTMYVGVSPEHGGTAPAQQLIDTGRRIAENIRFPGTTPVTPTFGLGELPAGVEMCTFDVETGSATARGANAGPARASTSYSLGTCDTLPPIQVSTGDADRATGAPGQPVQGRETRHDDHDGYLQLFVLDAVDGEPVMVAGRVALDELYDIANRLLLPE